MLNPQRGHTWLAKPRFVNVLALALGAPIHPESKTQNPKWDQPTSRVWNSATPIASTAQMYTPA
jgi:hypothetical protein